MTLAPPTVEYDLLAPLLLVFGAAVVGVLVEAFCPRGARYRIQLAVTVVAQLAALVATIGVWIDLRGTAGRIAVMGSVAVDRPAVFLQGTILVIGVLSTLLMSERQSVRHAVPGAVGARGLDAFTPQASAVPGSLAEKQATAAGLVQTEVFPLTLFAVGGMMLFAGSEDLLTMFVALEVFSLPLYLMCGLARRRRLLSQEAALKYFLLGAFSSAFLDRKSVV